MKSMRAKYGTPYSIKELKREVSDLVALREWRMRTGLTVSQFVRSHRRKAITNMVICHGRAMERAMDAYRVYATTRRPYTGIATLVREAATQDSILRAACSAVPVDPKVAFRDVVEVAFVDDIVERRPDISREEAADLVHKARQNVEQEEAYHKERAAAKAATPVADVGTSSGVRVLLGVMLGFWGLLAFLISWATRHTAGHGL